MHPRTLPYSLCILALAAGGCGEEAIDRPFPEPTSGTFPLEDGFDAEFDPLSPLELRALAERLLAAHLERLFTVDRLAVEGGVIPDAIGWNGTGGCSEGCAAKGLRVAQEVVRMTLRAGEEIVVDDTETRWVHTWGSMPGLDPTRLAVSLRSPMDGVLDVKLELDGVLTARGRLTERSALVRADLGPWRELLERMDGLDDLGIDLLPTLAGRIELGLRAEGTTQLRAHVGIGRDLRVVGDRAPSPVRIGMKEIGFVRAEIDAEAGLYALTVEGSAMEAEAPIALAHEGFYPVCADPTYACEDGAPGRLIGQWSGPTLSTRLTERNRTVTVGAADVGDGVATIERDDGTVVGAARIPSSEFTLELDDTTALLSHLEPLLAELDLDLEGLVHPEDLPVALQSNLTLSAASSANSSTRFVRHPYSSGARATRIADVLRGELELRASDGVTVTVAPGQCLVSQGLDIGSRAEHPLEQLTAAACN